MSNLSIVDKIKLVREAVQGCGIREAKDAVEATNSVDEAIIYARMQSIKVDANASVVVAAALGGGFVVTARDTIVFAASTMDEVSAFLKINVKPFGRANHVG